MEAPVARNLWDASRREAMLALYHPFVTSIACGKLKLGAFQGYIAQDAFFLRTFAEAFGLAMKNVRDREIKLAISRLRQGAYEELDLHSSLAKDWNIDLQKLGVPNAATTSYTSFLLNVARGNAEQDPEEQAAMTIGAMVPCMRLYAFLGQTIREAADVPVDHPYGNWISTYASSDFEGSAAEIEDVLDRLSSSVADFETLDRLYRRAMTLEVDFFNAQPFEECLNVPLLSSAALKDRRVVIVSDFDSTCTVADSSPVLAELNGDTSKRTIWETLSSRYFQEYTHLLNDVIADGQDGSIHYDFETVAKALEPISAFEKQGNEDVIGTRVLGGIKLDAIKQAALEMPLQEGCAQFFQRVASEHRSITCHILSVCWSQIFIEAVLAKGGIKDIVIHSNELSNDGYQTDGGLIRRIETPLDKAAVLLDTICSSQRDDKFVMYVGDSLTDLLCLLQADLGIVVGKSSSLESAARALGAKMVPLYRGLLLRESACEGWRSGDGILYTASGWHEIEAFALGYHGGTGGT